MHVCTWKSKTETCQHYCTSNASTTVGEHCQHCQHYCTSTRLPGILQSRRTCLRVCSHPVNTGTKQYWYHTILVPYNTGTIQYWYHTIRVPYNTGTIQYWYNRSPRWSSVCLIVVTLECYHSSSVGPWVRISPWWCYYSSSVQFITKKEKESDPLLLRA